MGLKPDHWIKKMALEQGMIDPFIESQVRNGVISYGVSSYGYDIRIADEFKIFTNVFSAIVDPKDFDPRSMVDFRGDVCIIPPNSFVLGRTIEYFRIPRGVLTVCLGKSTYARCFSGDTRVALVDGTAPTLEEMTRRHDDGEMFWGYSMGPHGRIIVSWLDAPRYIGRDALLEITLDDGATIHCTPDHEFITRDGRLEAADNLRPGDSLMPLYRDLWRGYEMVFQPLNGHMFPTHRLADEWNIRNGVYADEPDTHRLNCDRTVFRRFPDVVAEFKGKRSEYNNHKIQSIKNVPGDHDVYCLTVPEAGNFALEAGVFVRNCGLIVNVTPFEPEWEGYVTMEISNTTPLPAKIYANEGIAQVLFFEADEECTLSYADKKGKYQGQQTIVLPKL